MASIRAIKGKKRTTYRVEAMIDRVRIPSQTFKTKSDAERYAAILTLQADTAVDSNYRYKHTTLLSDLIREYLRQYSGKDTSRRQRLIKWEEELGSLPIAQVTRDKIKKVLRELQVDGLTNATHNRYKAALSAVFRFADQEFSTDYNPCKGIPNKPEGQQIDRWATECELKRIFAAARHSSWDRLYLLILMAVHTGARRSSLLSLRWSAIDFQNRTAYLATSKNKQPIVLPLNPEVISELERHREIGNGLIFPHPSNIKVPMRNFDYHWQKVLDRAAIDQALRFHDLRHTTGSWLAQAGVVTTEIQQILCHKSIATTQRYIHHSTSGKAETLQRVFAGLA